MTDRGWEFGWSAAVTALSLSGGFVAGNPWAGLAAGGLILAGRHLYHLSRLARAMAHDGRVPEPAPRGLWRGIYLRAGELRSRGRRRKRRLSRFLARFREAAAALPDAAVILGREDRVEWLNPAGVRLLGLCWPADQGAMLTDRIHDPTLAAYLAEHDELQSIQLRSPVDGAKVLSVRAVPFGKKHQRLVVARDVTRAHHADRAADDFTASVSHELRTPLTVLCGFLESFAEEPGRPTHDAEAIALMREQAARMSATVEDLLELSRLRMHSEEPEFVPVPVPGMLAEIVEDARALSAERAHVLHLDADPDLAIRGNPSLLRGAFSNLVFNAVRHTPQRSEVTIRWWRDGNGAHLEVRDDGEGIPARHLPRLTEPFYRVDPSRSRETGGTGLGLSIVQHALDRHGAELQIDSAAGRGTTFVCHFPTQAVVSTAHPDARNDRPAPD